MLCILLASFVYFFNARAMKLHCFLYCLVGVLAPTFEDKVHNSATQTKAVEERIAGGQRVDNIRDFPYQVSIKDIFGLKFCSGAIISENYILTAAHCVNQRSGSESVRPELLVVRGGSVMRGEGTNITIAEIVLHPHFDEPQNNLDIAYLRTASPIVFTEDIHPGVLAAADGTVPDEVTVTGWGNRERISSELMQVTLSVINRLRCQVAYPEIGITRNVLCAENTESGEEGACRGDGGSPASRNGRLYGLSSFTKLAARYEGRFDTLQ